MKGEAERPKIFQVALGFYMVLAAGAVFWLGWIRGQLTFDLFLETATWWKDCAAGLAVAAILLGGWNLAGRKFDSIGLLENRIREILGPMTVEEAVGLALISGFTEELFFRGAMQGAWGWLPATAIFGLLHSGPGAEFRPWTLFAVIAGLWLAGLMLWSGNLLASIVCHVAVNAASLTRLSGVSRQPRGEEMS